MSTSASPQLAVKELEFLRKAIKKRQIPTPITKLSLKSVGKEQLFERLGALAELDRDAALAAIEAALAGGSDAEVPPPQSPAAQMVWTGPDVYMSEARKTTAIVLALLGSAQEEVVIAGYEFDYGRVLFEPLHEAMKDRGVRASIFLDVRPAPSVNTKMDSYLALQAHKFIKQNWPFGAPVPDLFYFPEGARHGSRASLHAKCIIVDRRHVVIGSANFTQRGHSRNLEVGVCIEDPNLAGTLTRQFQQLVEAGHLVPLPAPAAPSVRPPEELATEESEDETPERSELDALADELLVAGEMRPFFLRLMREGLPAPLVGEDIEALGGHVLGSAELSWSGPRVAVLLPEQEGGRKALEGADWTCFSLPEANEAFDVLRELIERAE